MKTYILRIILLAPLLMAFQCDDEIESTLIFSDYKTSITPAASFSTNDTIWIKGIISSKIFDTAVSDSIFNEDPQVDVFSVFKLIPPTEISNCKDALDEFELIFDIGDYSFLSACENADIQALPSLNSDTTLYTYRLGLQPLTTGDFVISLQNGILQNEDRNTDIIENYLIENNPNQIGFDRCGSISSRILNDSDKEYYFTVE